MAVHTDLIFASVDELMLDPLNPRLGRGNTGRDVSQQEIMDLMRDWTLDELAVSYLESGGFWTQEALLVVKDALYGELQLVVVEGNRRLAALKYLRNAYRGQPASRKWAEIAESAEPPEGLFDRVPCLLIDRREDVHSFLGFRHVTGIKEWKPPEKAGFIAHLIDEQGLTYQQVMRKIGSKTPTVRQHYISYRIALQIDESVEEVPEEEVESRFSVMYLSLRSRGVQQYLHIDILAEPEAAQRPVPDDHLDSLRRFAIWLFGTEEKPPLFTDSRRVDDFGKILESDEAVVYLERSEKPRFEVAYRIAGGDEAEIVRYIEAAADNIELSLSRVHLYKRSEKIRAAVHRVGAGVGQLLSIFPDIRSGLEEEG